jgi:carboxymethylenebutenolidase
MHADRSERENRRDRNQVERRLIENSPLALIGAALAALMLFGSSFRAEPRTPNALPQAGDVNAETVQYSSGEAKIEAYLAKPKSSGKHPAVVVVHDTQGLSENIEDVSRRFAAEGFVALAPDLLSRGGGTKSAQQASGAIAQLSPDRTVDDLKAALDFLGKNPDVDPAQISAIGFGWGGWRVFRMAAATPSLSHAVIFYGVTPTDGLDGIHAPVLAHYAQYDFRITGNALWTERTMAGLGEKFADYVYTKAQRGFFDEKGNTYDPDAAKLAWTRTLDFLKSPVAQ